MKIEKVRFFEYGAKAPTDSRFTGTMNSEALIGWFEYTSNDEKKEDHKNITLHEDGYFGYTSSHTSGTFSSEGELVSEEQKNNLKKLIKKSFSKNGNLCWDYIISLESDIEAEECGLTTPLQWYSMVKAVLPKIFKEYGFDSSNMIWWFDVHRNTEHPHIHLTFLEKNQTRTHAKISKKQLENTKRFFWTEISARKDLTKLVEKNYIDFFKDKDNAFKELINSVDDSIRTKKINLNVLYSLLPRTGRLQYNSFQLKSYRPLIDSVIDDIIENTPDLQKQFNNFFEKVEMLEKAMNKSGNVSTIKEAEMNKLRERIGNLILKNFKKRDEVIDDNFKIKINSFQQNELESRTFRIHDYDKHKQYNKKIIIKRESTCIKKGKHIKARKIFKKRFLTKKQLASEISLAAYEQEREIDEALNEYYRRMEQNLII